MIVIVASSSLGVATGISAALEPLRRKGASNASAPPSDSARSGSRSSGSPRRSRADRERSGSGCARESSIRAAGSTRSSLTFTDRAISSIPRSSGIRITVASTPSRSTTAAASASSVVCSERLCANVREISWWAWSCFDFSRSDASSSFRSSLSVVTSSCSRAFSTTTASWPASAVSSARSFSLSVRRCRG